MSTCKRPSSRMNRSVSAVVSRRGSSHGWEIFRGRRSWGRVGMRRLLRMTLQGLIGAVSALSLSGTAFAQTTWTGLGANDFWFNAANWDTLQVPNGIAVDVIVGAPSPTIVNGNVDINSLTVDAAGAITLNANLDFNFGGTATTTLDNAGSIFTSNNTDFQLARTVNNSGNITVNNAGNLTDLEVIADGATLDGGGTITLQGTTGNSRIMGLTGAVLTIASQTIQGQGQVGANSLGIVNQANGLIDANISSELLTVDPSNSGNMINQGTLRASSGGILQLSGLGGGNFNNAGGLIEAQNGSTVRLSNASIIGGTLSTSGTGVISVDANSNSLVQDLTLAGDVQVLNNTDLALSGAINNTGSITINNLGNLTDIEVQSSGATLTGGGVITLQGTTDFSRIMGVAGSPTLTIANQTIQGRGQLGANSIGIVNQTGNLIDANSSGFILQVDPSAAGNMINQGTMRASGGGVLQLTGSGAGNFNNAGGLIEAQNGSTVRLSNASISHGVLSSTGTGVISVDANSNSHLQDLTVSGDVQVLNNTDLGLTGAINNTGSITISNLGNATDIEIQAGGATLTGGGVITLQGSTDFSRIMGVAGSPTLTIANQTIQGRGQVGANSIGVINQAGNLIDANSSGFTLQVDPSAAGNMINQGTMRASGGGVLQLSGLGGGDFVNTGGQIEAQNGSTVQITNATVINGTLSTSGTGVILVDANSNSFLKDLTVAGNMQVQNNTDLGFSGTINNTGSIVINNLGNATDIVIQTGGATLTGGGTVKLQGTTGFSRIEGVGGNQLFTNLDQTIQGFGNIGTNSIAIVNAASGLIHAESSGKTLTIDPSNAGNLLNNGTLRASGGGELLLSGLGGGSFSGGGTYEALDGGLLRADSNSIVNSLMGGTISEGIWRSIDGGGGAAIRYQNDTVVMPTTIGAAASVELSGANSAFTFRLANTSIDSSLNNVQGALALRNGRVMGLSGGLNNSGSILVDGSTTSLNLSGDFSQTAGSLILASNAMLQLSGSNNTVSGGLVGGNGTIDGHLDNLSGLLSPGLSPGVLEVTGDYSQGLLASLAIEIGGLTQGTDYDLLSIGGSAILNGELLVSLYGGFTPDAMDTFTILSGGTVTGTFANALAQVNVAGGGTFDVTYTSTSVILGNFNAVPEPSSVSLLLLSSLGAVLFRRRVNQDYL